ncbi:MAG: oligosaccharide flippase family protein [Acidobacteriota bacterium]|nr:oligosaccharide flippase family protein [Acidobacteriota bacterium]
MDRSGGRVSRLRALPSQAWQRYRGNADLQHAMRNLGGLYLLYLSNYLLGLLITPLLARRLGPASFGHFAAAQAYALTIGAVVEFGFNFSANAAAQRLKDDRNGLSLLYSGVTCAKLAIFVLVVGLSALLPPVTVAFAGDNRLLLASMAWALSMGLGPIWLYQGIGQLRLYSRLDLSIRVALALAVILLVSASTPIWVVQTFYAISAFISLALTTALICKQVDPVAPSLAYVMRCIKEAAPLFLYRLTGTVQPFINPLILGSFAPAAAVGNYAGAEKVSRFAAGLLSPLCEAVYPYVFHRARNQPSDAGTTALRLLAINMSLGLSLAVALFVGAPWIARAFLGSAFTEVPSILRILALTPLLVGMTNALGVHWMLPTGLTRSYNAITVSTFAVHIAVGAAASAAYGPLGMGAAVVFSSVFALIGMGVALKRNATKKRSPEGVSLGRA